MNYLKIDPCDLNNGIGARVVLWVSGCGHMCKGCHNPESWDETGGSLFSVEDKNYLFQLLDNPYITGLTISGGDPLHPSNIKEVISICKDIKNTYMERFKDKDIWLWTGYDFKDIPQEIINVTDYIVDGKFQEELKAPIPWRGSSNQNIYHKGELVEL